MKFNKKQLRRNMREATKNELGVLWPDVREYMEAENRKMIESLKMIHELRKLNRIDLEMAQALIQGQKEARTTLLLSIDGLKVIMIERTLNAALDSIRESVNTVLDFELL
uniref:Uncharacterized protein n=1 Tax=uncultured Thiotrichaceae bacterium TaxID=298394 RepID=A0A6S6U452_9GAMM|nr:MAG: Unknown protein [uncultured Thiotrichaceae bacterium]